MLLIKRMTELGIGRQQLSESLFAFDNNNNDRLLTFCFQCTLTSMLFFPSIFPSLLNELRTKISFCFLILCTRFYIARLYCCAVWCVVLNSIHFGKRLLNSLCAIQSSNLLFILFNKKRKTPFR